MKVLKYVYNSFQIKYMNFYFCVNKIMDIILSWAEKIMYYRP